MVEEFNGTIGVGNISGNSSNATGLTPEELQSEVGNLLVSQLGGSVQMASMVALGLMGVFLYRSDVSEDVSAAVLIPSTFLMASEGFLPYGEGIFFASLLAVAGIFIFGLIKYADR